MDRISDAIKRNDFSGLADGIKGDVNDFSDKLANQSGVNWTPGGAQAGSGGNSRQGTYAGPGANRGRGAYGGAGWNRNAGAGGPGSGAWFGSAPNSGGYRQRPQARVPVPYFMNRPKKGTAILEIIFGIIGCLIFIPTFFSMLFSPLGSAEAILSAAIGGAFSAGCVVLLLVGLRDRNMNNAFYRYADYVGQKELIDIRALAVSVGEPDKTVLRQLHRLVKKKIFPRARFNEQESALLLTDGAWQRYCEAEKTVRERAAQEKEEENADRASANAGIIRYGREFIRKMEHAAAELHGTPMEEKLNRLSDIVDRIMDRVRTAQGPVTGLDRFTEYYLPTTEKLVDSYRSLSQEPEIGTNIRDTKREIEEAVDSINEAFEVLFDSLYEKTAWDVSSDISVMKAMMEQDGLAGGIGEEEDAR